MKIKIVLLLITVIFYMGLASVNAQKDIVTGLKYKLGNTTNDTVKAYTLDSLSMYYMFYTDKYDSSFYYINQSINNAFSQDNKKFLILAYARLGFYYLNTAQLNAGLNISFKGLQLAEENSIADYTSTLYYDISFIYYNLGDSALSIQNAIKGVQAFAANKDPFYDIPLHLYGHISSIYADGNSTHAALNYLHLMDSVVVASKERAAKDISFYYWTNYYLDFNDYTQADSVIALGIASCEEHKDFLLKSFYLYRSVSYYNQGRYKETITAAGLARDLMDIGGLANALNYLQLSYNRLGKIDSAYYYLRMADSVRNVVHNQSNINETQQIQFNGQLNRKEAEANQALQNEKNRNRIISYVFLTALLFLILFGFSQWRNNMQKKHANTLLQQEKEKVENTLTELKSTQAQLIQSEKMASLGELTAGIAHEIQNPLNFVNNFSEVNKELIEELKIKNEKLKIEDDEINDLLNDLADNEEKINHHGKRADSIVKGMLQHSRQTKGMKEPTDINALCDEYLRLSYHGLRAKDKNFNADFKTDFDETIGNINIVPQDIGRVLLNLFNNAFYATSEK